MRLDEISSRDLMVFNMKKWKNFDHIERFLRSKKYKKLDQGAFSSVWIPTNPSDRVVKISRGDQCWLSFVNIVKSMPNNQHFPKISSLRVQVVGYDEVFISTIERLQPLKENSPSKFSKITTGKELTRLFIENIISSDSIINDWSLWRYYNGELSQFMKSEFYKKSNLSESKPELFKQIGKLVKKTKFWKTLMLVKKKINKGQCFFDIHSGNIMVRPQTGDLVIIDPFAKGYYLS